MEADLHYSDKPFSLCEPDGTLDQESLEVCLDRDFLEELYHDLKVARAIDQRAINLQRQGKLGTYAPCEGQEGCQVGAVLALEKDDPLFPTYRETAALLTRGVSLTKILQYWSGDERGSELPPSLNVFPTSVPVGSQGLHGVGAAKAFDFQDRDRVPMVFLGDGATSEGDMLEAFNFAGAWDTPVLFFCQNNQWAISVPRGQQTASQTLAQKAIAFGFDGYRVDGNDPIACYQLIDKLRNESLQDSEPVFIEALTYRIGNHTTSDDASRYRSEDEVEQWREKDPLMRIRRLLEKDFDWKDSDEDQLETTVETKIDEAVETFESFPEQSFEEIFDYTFENIPSSLQTQKQNLLDELDQ